MVQINLCGHYSTAYTRVHGHVTRSCRWRALVELEFKSTRQGVSSVSRFHLSCWTAVHLFPIDARFALLSRTDTEKSSVLRLSPSVRSTFLPAVASARASLAMHLSFILTLLYSLTAVSALKGRSGPARLPSSPARNVPVRVPLQRRTLTNTTKALSHDGVADIDNLKKALNTIVT